MARRPVTRCVTLRDIARRTGVHESTVSRALNARTRHLVADDAAARIVATARALGYRPNYMAAALRTRRSMSVGLVVDDLADATTAATLAGIETTLRDAGYTLTVIATGGDPARLAAAIAMLDGHGADGAILLDRQPASQPDGAPPPLPLVTADDLPDVGAAGIGHVVAHLVRRGHRAIGHLAGPADRIAGQARLAAFRSAMTAAGLFVTAIEPCPAFSIDAGMRGASALLARRPGLTALVAADDRLAVGALDAIAAAGQRCPQDVSVAGIGDLPLAGRLTPPLTSVRIDTTAAGRRAVRRLLDFLGEAGAPPENPVTADLIERGSTGAAPAR